MKKIFTLLFVGASSLAMAQTTATNFTVTDCASAAHTLFTELDAGKVIVMTWVMPCGACIAGAGNASSAAKSYASSNPGVVKFYLVDDAGNSACSTLTSWASTNSITTDAVFSNSGNAINMNSYGSSGMPKIVVLGGSNHTVYYNVNGSGSTSAIQTAINNALAALSTGIANPISNSFAMNIFPNPSNSIASISYSLESSSDVKIELFNLVGEKVKSVFAGNQNAGEQKLNIDCTDLNSGIYFVKRIAGKTEKTITLSVVH